MTKLAHYSKAQRRAILPAGCNSLAQSSDPRALLLAIQIGNRATRREAARKLAKTVHQAISEGREL